MLIVRVSDLSLSSKAALFGSNPQPEFKTKKPPQREVFFIGSDCRIISLRFIHCAHRLTATAILCLAFACSRTNFSLVQILNRNLKQKNLPKRRSFLLAPTVGFEPTTNRLTADCSTAELSRNNLEAGTGIEPI